MKLLCTKDRGGLIKVSNSVRKVCMINEQCLQCVMKTTGVPRAKGIIVTALCSSVLHVVSERFPWVFAELDEHDLDSCALGNHKHALIKCIFMCFSKIRLHHIAKTHSEKIQVVLNSICLCIMFINLKGLSDWVQRFYQFHIPWVARIQNKILRNFLRKFNCLRLEYSWWKIEFFIFYKIIIKYFDPSIACGFCSKVSKTTYWLPKKYFRKNQNWGKELHNCCLV